MGKNWFEKTANDYVFGVSDVVDVMVSGKSAAESTKASAQNTKVALQDTINNIAAALANNTIINITADEKADLQAKAAVVNTMIAACNTIMSAVDAFIAGMKA